MVSSAVPSGPAQWSDSPAAPPAVADSDRGRGQRDKDTSTRAQYPTLELACVHPSILLRSARAPYTRVLAGGAATATPVCNTDEDEQRPVSMAVPQRRSVTPIDATMKTQMETTLVAQAASSRPVAALAAATPADDGLVDLLSLVLWCGVLMTYIALGFYLTSLIYNVWQENANDSNGLTVDRIKGKEATQDVLLSVGCSIGGVGVILISARVWGAAFARPWAKLFAIAATVLMGALGYVASSTYPRPDATMWPNGRLGAGWEYADSAFTYTCVAVGLLAIHESLAHFAHRYRARRGIARAAAARLALVRARPDHVAHAVQARALADQLREEESHVSRPTSAAAATAAQSTPQLNDLFMRLLAEKDRLSRVQLNLLCALVAFFYIVQIGGLMYADVEGWDLRQSIQFSVVTIATIGYGNVVPTSMMGRGLLFLYFPIGFGIMSYTIALLWTHLFGSVEAYSVRATALARRHCCRPCRARQRNAERRAAQTRRCEARLARARAQQAAHRMKQDPRPDNTGAAPAVSRAPRDASTVADASYVSGASGLTSTGAMQTKAASLDDDLISAFVDEEELRALEEESSMMTDEDDLEDDAADDSTSDPESASASLRHADQRLILSFVLVLFILLGGAAVFRHYESTWTYFDSFYFCFCTLTTIGYGDFAPTVPQSQLFLVYFVMVGLGAIAYVLANINDRISKTMEIQANAAESAQSAAASSLISSAEAAGSARVRAVGSLPSWNERFLAARFELERLGERLEAQQREQRAPTQGDTNEMRALIAAMDELAQTVARRQIQVGDAEDERVAALTPRAFASTVAESDADLDLSSYGILPGGGGGASVPAPPGKKLARVVVPRHVVSPRDRSRHLAISVSQFAASRRADPAAGEEAGYQYDLI